jgi:hypothetical protein
VFIVEKLNSNGVGILSLYQCLFFVVFGWLSMILLIVLLVYFFSVVRLLNSFQGRSGFSSCDVILFEGGLHFSLHIIWENTLVVLAGSTSKQQCLPPKLPTTT